MRCAVRSIPIAAALALGGVALAQPAQVSPPPAQTPGTNASGGSGGVVRIGTPELRRSSPTTSVQDLAHIAGQSRSPLRGIGIVTGLRGTGDSGSELVLARPMAEVYRNNGNPIGELKDLAKAKSAAIVTMWAMIPEEGGMKGDPVDVYVQVSHSASSLKGGSLVISPLLHPLPNMPEPVFGYASGLITIEDPEIPTVGVIRGGGQLIKDVRPGAVGDEFTLVIRPAFRSYKTASELADAINGPTADLEYAESTSDVIATAIDDATIRVVIPAHERSNPARFVGRVMATRFNPLFMDLPAQVVVNERTGSIVLTGDVEVSAVTVGSDRLVITTTTPAPVPTALNPLSSTSNFTEFGTATTPTERARLQDLLDAFKRLSVPTREQIQILEQISRTGRLHARFVRE